MIRALSILAAFALAAPAAAQVGPPKRIASFDAWEAYVFVEPGNKKTCFITASATQINPKIPAREPYIMIRQAPAAKVADEVSLYPGYSLKKDSKVGIKVGKDDLELTLVQGDTAWAKDADADKALVKAMRAGKDMTVRGVNTRNETSTDSYSLAGFGRAYDAIVKECPVK
ncbi:MAG: hypothetical protein FJX46_13320 [Alphaproteobacteria bacterium]|nr:hypothetical protein [Alphaproteobacteria bacterium]